MKRGLARLASGKKVLGQPFEVCRGSTDCGPVARSPARRSLLGAQKSLDNAAGDDNHSVMVPNGPGQAQPPPSAARLDATFAALGDPTRRAILARLSAGEASVMELAAPFAMSQPAISKHLKVLERAGLIARGSGAHRRPCRLVARPLKEATDWLERYRRFWEGNYQLLDELLEEMKAAEPDPADDPQSPRPPDHILPAEPHAQPNPRRRTKRTQRSRP